jgi:hypothetical protein
MILVLFQYDSQGQTKYFTIDDRERNLFCPWTFSIGWGRSPNTTPRKRYEFSSEKDKANKIREILAKKLKTYTVLYSYFGQGANSFIYRLIGANDDLSRANVDDSKVNVFNL